MELPDSYTCSACFGRDLCIPGSCWDGSWGRDYDLSLLTAGIALKLGFVVDDGNSEYIETAAKHPLFSTIGMPIVEEGFFRGILQPPDFDTYL